MKKVEIIIESVYTKRLMKVLSKNNIQGYTLIKDIEGSGAHGLKTADNVSEILSNDYLFTICNEEQYENTKEAIKDFINIYGGKCFVSDASILI
jgi:nitrogen regulatory protein PII